MERQSISIEASLGGERGNSVRMIVSVRVIQLDKAIEAVCFGIYSSPLHIQDLVGRRNPLWWLWNWP